VQTFRTLASDAKLTAPTWLPISERALAASQRWGVASGFEVVLVGAQAPARTKAALAAAISRI
jgi:hypothetical protein